MSRSRGRKAFTARQKVAIVAAPVSASLGLLGYGLYHPDAAGAANGSKDTLFDYVDDTSHHVTCKITQHIEHPRNNDGQLAFGSTQISFSSGDPGTDTGDCTSFVSLSQRGSWPDPDGFGSGSNTNTRNAPLTGAAIIEREYAPYGSNITGNTLTLSSSVTFTHCTPNVPEGNACTASFTFTK